MKFGEFVSADICQAAVEQSPAHKATLYHRKRKVAEKRLHECSGLSWGTAETLSCVYASDHAVTCMGGFLIFLFFHCIVHKWRRHKGAYPAASRYASRVSTRHNKVVGKVHKIWRRQKRAFDGKVFRLKVWCLVLYYLILGKLYRARTRFKKKVTPFLLRVKSAYMKVTFSIYHHLPPLRVSAMVIFLGLFMSGDIELNPGPKEVPQPTCNLCIGHLTLDDLREVRKAIWDARSKWFTLGIELKISVNTLEAIKQKNKENPDDCLTETLLEWLKQANPKPTWSCIVTALREPTVGLEQLAESIESQHLKIVHIKDLTTSENEASCSSDVKLGKRRTRDKLWFPHIDEIAPDKEQRKALEERLQIESKQIMFEFYVLINKFFDSLEEQAISAQKLERYLRMPLQTEKLTISTVQDAQKIIEDNSSFYDYQLVEYMIEVAGTENDRQALQKYKASFIHYAQRRVFECPAKLATRTSGDIKLMIKLDSHYKCKLAELKEFQERVCQILQIPFYVSKLHCVKKGCFQITFLIPSYIQKIAFPLTSEQKSDLAKLKVLCLVCGEFQEVFRKGGAEMDHNTLDSESDSDDDCEKPIVKSISSEVDDLIHAYPVTITELVKTSSVDQIGSSRTTRKYSMERSERRRQTGRSAASPTSSPIACSPSSMSPTMWNFDTPSSTPPPRMSPMSEYSHSLRIFPRYGSDSSVFHHSTPIEPVSHSEGALPHDLLVAAANGEMLNVAILINLHHIDVHYKDSQGNSALHHAAMYGHLNVIKYLILHGAPITDLGQDEMSLLHIASKFNHMHIVHFLISECTDINPCCLDCYKRTPFFVACMYGQLEIAQYLLQALLKYKELEDIINSKDVLDETVIHTVCKMGHIEIVKWLVSGLNCNPNNIVPGWMNRVPLHYAAENGHTHIIKLLIEDLGCNPSCADINGVTPLLLASFNGQLEVVRYLALEKLCDPMCKDNVNNTPLHTAAFRGHITTVKFFISVCNCDPNTPGKDNRTPLHYAAGNGHLPVVRYLVHDCMCNLSRTDSTQQTALHLASMNGHMDIVKYLIQERGCDPVCRDINNNTPLHAAAFYGYLNIVQFFVTNCNCDPNMPGQEDRTPLYFAAENNQHDIILFLISCHNCVPMISDKNGHSPLHIASQNGHLNILHILKLTQKPTELCSYKDKNGDTPLHLAALKGHLNVVKFFLSHDGYMCDPNIQGWANRTILHIAAESGHLNIVKLLTEEYNCDPSSVDIHKISPLHLASLNGHMNIVRYLCIKKNCDPLWKDNDCNTSLHAAAFYGHLEIVNFFLEKLMCDPCTPGWKNRIPLHYAAENGHLSLVKSLINDYNCNASIPDADNITPLFLASMNGHLDTIKYLTSEKHCDPLCKDDSDMTPFHAAAFVGHFEAVNYFIADLKCNVNSTGRLKRTPLHYAAENDHLNIVKYILKSEGCQSGAIDAHGTTPLHLAAAQGHLDVVKYLTLDMNSDPTQTDFYLNTPLHDAARNGHMKIVEFLIKTLHCPTNVRGSFHMTPQEWAFFKGHYHIVRYFSSIQ